MLILMLCIVFIVSPEFYYYYFSVFDIVGVQMTSKMFYGLLTTLLTIGHLTLSPLAAPSVASFVNEQGSEQ